MTAHELARLLLAGPDVEVHVNTSCCGCYAPKYQDRPLRVEVEPSTVLITDAPAVVRQP